MFQTPNKKFPTVQPILAKKLFANYGFEAFYFFQLSSPFVALDQNARIYIEFPFFVPPRLNKEGAPECYIRETNSELEAGSLTFCELGYGSGTADSSNFQDISSQ